MLALSFIRDNAELVRQGALRKGEPAPIEEILDLDQRHRLLLGEEESARAEMNTRSANLPRDQLETARSELARLKGRIQQLGEQRRSLQEQLDQLLLLVPNLPHESVPDGTSDKDNLVVTLPPENTVIPRCRRLS